MAQLLAESRKHITVDSFLARTSFLRGLISDDGSRLRRLDHSQKPRLVNMQLTRKDRRAGRDLLTMLLGKGSPLIRERIAFRKGMMYWFSRGEDTYENQIVGDQASVHDILVESVSRYQARHNMIGALIY
jgi:hypothetical protein